MINYDGIFKFSGFVLVDNKWPDNACMFQPFEGKVHPIVVIVGDQETVESIAFESEKGTIMKYHA